MGEDRKSSASVSTVRFAEWWSAFVRSSSASLFLSARHSSLITDHSSLTKTLGAHEGHSPLTISRASIDVKNRGYCRLTDSPARTDVALFLHRAVRLLRRRADLSTVFTEPFDPFQKSARESRQR